MKKVVIISVCILSSMMVVFAQKNFLDVGYVEVSGTAKMEVVPDRICLRIVINETDSKGKIAVHNQEQDMISALKTIQGINITEDLTMKDLESKFKYRKVLDNQIFLSKEYELVVKSGKTASEVITKLEKTGISNISLLKIDHSQIEQFRRTVLENAIKEAKAKASSLAESIGQSIGKAIHINERQVYMANRSELYLSKSASYEAAGEYASDVEFSKIKIEATVDVKFELK
ncbi:MAG: SIMPL domain-containing protein [Bacteroidales bacterium]|nr:SIMPL domain-containing protein [Bacteroidales bacterium]